MQFWTLDEIEQHAMADHEVGEEISPGVTITRRRILQARSYELVWDERPLTRGGEIYNVAWRT
jgi:hypothetical protein